MPDLPLGGDIMYRRPTLPAVWALVVLLTAGTASQAQQAPSPAACDTDKDGIIDDRDFRTCLEQDFRSLAAGRDSLTPESYGNVDHASEPRPGFADLDINQDSKVTLEEFALYYGERFKGAAAMNGGRMTIDEYASWRQSGVTGR